MAAESRPTGGAVVPTRQDMRFLLLYALAYAGGIVAYAPLLTLLLPLKMALAAGEGRVEWLAHSTFFGAIAASIANIVFGWASDRTQSRRGWIGAGLVLTLMAYAVLYWAETPLAICITIIGWQMALNMMLGPLVAYAADHVPDHQKGTLGGLLGAGPPIGALSGMMVTLPMFQGEGPQFALVCLLIGAMVAPLLLFGRVKTLSSASGASALPRGDVQRGIGSGARESRRVDLALSWTSRLLVQIGNSVLFAFLFYYFQSLDDGGATPALVARVIGITLIAAIPLALLLGVASDRVGSRQPFLVGASMTMAVGLCIMAAAPSLWVAIVGYGLFGCANAIFLALHSVYAMQMLPSPGNRGRDLGVFNLTNTLPAIISPLLVLMLVPRLGFTALMAALACLAVGAALLILRVGKETIESA